MSINDPVSFLPYEKAFEKLFSNGKDGWSFCNFEDEPNRFVPHQYCVLRYDDEDPLPRGFKRAVKHILNAQMVSTVRFETLPTGEEVVAVPEPEYKAALEPYLGEADAGKIRYDTPRPKVPQNDLEAILKARLRDALYRTPPEAWTSPEPDETQFYQLAVPRDYFAIEGQVRFEEIKELAGAVWQEDFGNNNLEVYEVGDNYEFSLPKLRYEDLVAIIDMLEPGQTVSNVVQLKRVEKNAPPPAQEQNR